MACFSQRPTPDLRLGAAVLSETLPDVLSLLGAEQPPDLGWSMPDAHTLLVPMQGVMSGVSENFLLRLHFRTGREWPPSAQFVNPDTWDYDGVVDRHHVPALTSPSVHTHPEYNSPYGTCQLICCSATYEYYDVLHGGEERHLWRETDTFYRTIHAIETAMRTHYQGRHPRHAV